MSEIVSPTVLTSENPAIGRGAVPVEKGQKHAERTFGLKVVDGIIYPIINNAGVFTISVGFTFLTKHGNEVGEYFRDIKESTNNPVVATLSLGAEKFSEFWAWRGDQTVNWLQNTLNMEKDSAEMAKMVTFSFLDGCLLAPAVKLLEDRRGDFAKGIDTFFGTKPEDESIYDAEPTQTWASVLGGRALTAAIVVPTAVAMDSVYLKHVVDEVAHFDNFNNTFLNKPGFALAEKFQQHFPEIAERIGTEVKESLGESRLQTLGKTGVFEAFYTSVCTAGLYVSSRFLAELGDKKQQEKEQYQAKEAQIRTPYTVVKDDAYANNIVPFNRMQADKAEHKGAVIDAPNKPRELVVS
jgi:hypothetical protein